MPPGSPEAWDRDLPAGEDELWEAAAEPSRRKVLDLIVARGQAIALASSSRVFHVLEPRSSSCRVRQNDSIITLS
jgi:hypothetical protein